LSVCRTLLLQRKPKLGHTQPLTGPHAARELDIAGLKRTRGRFKCEPPRIAAYAWFTKCL